MMSSKEEKHESYKPCKEAVVMWLQLNGCTDARLATKYEDQHLDFDIAASEDILFNDEEGEEEHRIILKSMHWSVKCCTKSLCFEANKYAGIEYDPTANQFRAMKKFNPPAATDILFALLEDTKWSECLLVRRDRLEKYAKYMLEHDLYATYLKKVVTLLCGFIYRW